MDAVPKEMPVERGKLCQLPSGLWYVHCRWCDEEARLEAPNEEEAYGMLHEWRLSMPRRKYHQRNWSCPRCAEWWQDTTPTATDTAEAEAASQLAPTTATTTATDDISQPGGAAAQGGGR